MSQHGPPDPIRTLCGGVFIDPTVGTRQKGLELSALSSANKAKAQQRDCPLSFAEKNGNSSQMQTPVPPPAGASLSVALWVTGLPYW